MAKGGGRDTPSTAIGDAILGTKDLSRLWGLLEVQLNSITRCLTLDLGLFRTWKNRAGFGSVGVYCSVGSVVWMGLWCELEGAVQCSVVCSLFDRHCRVKGGGCLARDSCMGVALGVSLFAVLKAREVITWDVLP